METTKRGGKKVSLTHFFSSLWVIFLYFCMFLNNSWLFKIPCVLLDISSPKLGTPNQADEWTEAGGTAHEVS